MVRGEPADHGVGGEARPLALLVDLDAGGAADEVVRIGGRRPLKPLGGDVDGLDRRSHRLVRAPTTVIGASRVTAALSPAGGPCCAASRLAKRPGTTSSADARLRRGLHRTLRKDFVEHPRWRSVAESSNATRGARRLSGGGRRSCLWTTRGQTMERGRRTDGEGKEMAAEP